jgi:hypothetical protein
MSFPHALERRRPRHPHPEKSQGRVREAAIAVRAIMLLVEAGELQCGENGR